MTMAKITRNEQLGFESARGPRPRAGLLGLVVALAWLAAAVPSRAVLAAEFVIIHNVKASTPSLTKGELKDMSIGRKKTWSSGVPVQLVMAPVGAPEMKWFALFATGISQETLAAKMKQEVFKGELRRPVIVTSDRDCVSAVAADPGGVGVVSADTAKSLPEGVTVLVVQ